MNADDKLSFNDIFIIYKKYYDSKEIHGEVKYTLSLGFSQLRTYLLTSFLYVSVILSTSRAYCCCEI